MAAPRAVPLLPLDVSRISETRDGDVASERQRRLEVTRQAWSAGAKINATPISGAEPSVKRSHLSSGVMKNTTRG